MVINEPRFMCRSLNSNQTYWEQEIFPDWTSLRCYRHYPEGIVGTGVEPHYHDNDEIWLFTKGYGEVRLDGVKFDVTPGTLVYTPMGCIHQFQMFTPYENNAIVTRLEREHRSSHLTVEEFGPPGPTVPGFVVSGEYNKGAIPKPGSRCPIAEWRMLKHEELNTLNVTKLRQHEHWMVLEGMLSLVVEGQRMFLYAGDIALLQAGIDRQISTQNCSTRVVVVRENTGISD